MSTDSQDIKKRLDDISLSEFKEIYKEVTSEMLQKEQWSREEHEAMGLLFEGHDPQSIRKQMNLNAESSKKIADLYFMILLNTLIRSNIKLPFKVPEKEITSWDDNYPRDRFASDLLAHKKELKTTVVGREAIKAASEYVTLYKSTVDHRAEKKEQNSDSTQSKIVERACDSLGFLFGIADGLSFSPKSPQPCMLSMSSNSASAGYAVGIFARGVFELGGLVASLLIK